MESSQFLELGAPFGFHVRIETKLQSDEYQSTSPFLRFQIMRGESMNRLHQSIAAAVIIALADCLSGCGSADPADGNAANINPQAAPGNVDTSGEPQGDAPPEVTAVDLAQEFLTDPTAASAKYKRQVLIVTGTTHGAVYVNEGVGYCSFGLVGLEVPEDVESDVRKYYIACRFEGADKAEGVEKGQEVCVQGRFVNNIGGQILLHDCELLK